MANKMSKNARKGSTAEVLNCKCGGKITTGTRFVNHKIRNYAVCNSCKKEASKPRLLMGR